MKRFYVTCLASLLMLTGCSFGKTEIDNPLRIKSSRTEIPESDTIIESVYTYNDKGNLDKIEDFRDGRSDCVLTFEYDSLGNIIRKCWVYGDGNRSTVEYILTINDNHQIVDQETITDGNKKEIQEFTYDKYGNTIEINNIHYSGTNTNVINSKYEYDRNGNIIKREILWDNDPSMGGTTTYHYENGCLIHEELLATAGWCKSYIDYSYDESGLIQTAMEYNGKGSLQSKTVTTYDQYGNVLRWEYYSHTGIISGSGDDIADQILICSYEPSNLLE